MTIIICAFFAFVRKTQISGLEVLLFFGWFFLQLEAFIFLARIIFNRPEIGQARNQITKTVLIRFMVFYISCLVAAFIIYLIFKFILSIKTEENFRIIWNNFISYEFRGWFSSTTGGLVLGGIILITVLWQDALKREQKLREENLIFQNETLKSQVNPHFLFNSLNTLSSLIITQPSTAERFIGKLSSIYRYILENGSKDRVPLSAELTFLSDYFYLYQIRDEDKIQLEILVDEHARYEILPVSLQILVENAIKHNMATRENPLKISIYIEDRKVVVKNNLQKIATQIKTTGIGLNNLAQRAKLTSGYELETEKTENYFVVKVPLM
jgi:sensor histidine kinase YesM